MSEADRRATVRNASGDDELEMLELLFRAFRRWPAFEIQVPPLEHLRWKMRSDPIAARHQWVAEIDGRIVAMILRIVRRVRVRGRDCLARDGVDAAVDPHYQEQGLYGAILDHARESPQDAEFGLRFWYSTNPRTRRRSRPEEAESLANPVQVLQKPCDVRAIVARSRKKYGGRLPAPLGVLRIELERAFHRVGHRPYWRPAKPAWSITTLDRFDDRIDGFFDEAARPFDFVVVRTRGYMNWRYFDPAAGRFTVRVAEQQGRLLGYLVFKITEGEGYIADLLALPGRTEVVRSLVEDALRLFREAGVEQITCWMISRHPYNGILGRYGFIDSRRDVGFGYRATSLDGSELERLADPRARIHLTHGDTDWI
jgi:GNAT superfamily N-acetyltransferase